MGDPGACNLLPDQARGTANQSRCCEVSGKSPRGGSAPPQRDLETLGHLAAEGSSRLRGVTRPAYEIRTTSGPLVSVPYTLELNDIPMMVIQHHPSSEWLQRGKDQFDRLYLEGAKNPRVMALAVHPYISGVPHRIKYFEAVYDYMRKQKGVWFTTAKNLRWYKSQRRRGRDVAILVLGRRGTPQRTPSVTPRVRGSLGLVWLVTARASRTDFRSKGISRLLIPEGARASCPTVTTMAGASRWSRLDEAVRRGDCAGRA